MGEHPKNEYKFRLAQVYEFEMERKRKEIPHTGGRIVFSMFYSISSSFSSSIYSSP